ncbi:Component of a membrane-bound complex containing the Tor2p kinase [Coemansia sp. RSA 552]|nr:Component of a membrane-bound complex containing the Tor2p kinase [Coemansia sp. RSA 552]
MSLLTDPAFLVYQLRVSFLRTNDPAGERVLTFDDLSVPHSLGGDQAQQARQGSVPPSPMGSGGRRKTSASEIRQQVAQNTAANAYIMACGHYAETEVVNSPEIEHDEGYMYSRAAPRLAFTAGAVGRPQDGGATPQPNARYPDRAAGRNKRTNRNAKIAPTGEGREEVVGLGVVPSHPEMMLGGAFDGDEKQRAFGEMLKHRPLPAVEEAADSGSLSDSAQPLEPPTRHWDPEPMPPRRSLDTIRRSGKGADATATPSAARGDRRRHMGHAYSNSVATIRLQRPAELMRKGSSRDAIALGIDFDVKSMFESSGLRDHPEDSAPRKPSSSKSSVDGSEEKHEEKHEEQPRLGILKPRQRNNTGRHSRKKSAAGIELRARRNETSFKIPLTSLREDRSAGSTLLKRSATLPTKRAGNGNYSRTANAAGGHGGVSSQKSRWVGAACADDAPRPSNKAAGWVDGAHDTGWDHSSDEESDKVTPALRRGATTQTWYGPRAGIRPISMFPPAHGAAAHPLPPVPLLFGGDDSDDDIDLEGDVGSSRTPAALGLGLARGLRSFAGSPNPSIRSRKDSSSTLLDRSRAARFVSKPSTLATSVPVSPPLSLAPTPLALSGVKYDHLAQEAGGQRPRGISDPEGRQSSRSSHIQSEGSWRATGELDSSRPGSKDGVQRADGRTGPLRPASGSEPPTARGSIFPLSAGDSNSSSSNALAATGASNTSGASIADTAASGLPVAPKKSGLAALLATKIVVRQNPFSEEFGAIGSAAGDSGVAELNLFLQYGEKKSQPLTIRVRRVATVEQSIGFALHQYLDEELEPKLESDVQDVVMWSLRIAMDGEVDDDFPAFDRTRPVANFAFDEFALCLASPDQVKANEAIRVRQGRPPRMLRPKSLVPPTPSVAAGAPAQQLGTVRESSKPALLNSVVSRPEVSTFVLQPSRLAIASTAEIFVGTVPLKQEAGTPISATGQEPHQGSAGGLSAIPEPLHTRLLKVRVLGKSSSVDALRATTVEADDNATIRMVLAQICRKKQFTEEQYVLGIFDKTGFVVCNSDMSVRQIPQGTELYLHRVGAALPSLEYLERTLAPIYGQQQPPDEATAALAPEQSAMGLASSYYTFRVVRRAQMFTRHERSLVIDGDTITLLPSDHRAESAKTLTFHIGNIICKRNQKSPRKIRLLITRRGNTGEKSVDLETMTDEDATSICNILTRLADHCGM